MISLKKWFRSGPTSRDGLTQSQREAIVDLLNYCSFADHEIAHAEEITIDDLEYQLDWDHHTDFDYYVNKSIGAVRAAAESKDPTFFMEQLRKRLDSRQSREQAISLCEKLFKADGRVTAEESTVLVVVREALSEKKR